MENKLRQIETEKKIKKPYTGNSRASFYRKKKEVEIETKKKQELVVMKQEKTTEYMSLGIGEDQAKSLANYTVENQEETLAELITSSLMAKYKAKKELDNMVVNKKIKIENAHDWAFMRKALE